MHFWMVGGRGAALLALLPYPAAALAQVTGAAEDSTSEQVQNGSSPDDRDRSTSARTNAAGFTAEIGVGFRYDSNVVVDDIDLNTGLGDEILLVSARAEYEAALGSDTKVTGGYRFYQLAHDEFSNLDLQSHSFSAELERDFGNVDARLSYRFSHARLGGAGFVDLHRISPSLSGFASRMIYLRGAYIYLDKDFLGRDDRDAEVHGVVTDIYLLADGARRYFVLGYRFEDENARDPQFSFVSHEVSTRFVQRFEIAGRRARLRLTARYEGRDYDAETPSIAAIRDDDRLRLSGALEWQAADRFEITAGYEYSDFDSNLPVSNYQQSVVTISAGVRFGG